MQLQASGKRVSRASCVVPRAQPGPYMPYETADSTPDSVARTPPTATPRARLDENPRPPQRQTPCRARPRRALVKLLGGRQGVERIDPPAKYPCATCELVPRGGSNTTMVACQPVPGSFPLASPVDLGFISAGCHVLECRALARGRRLSLRPLRAAAATPPPPPDSRRPATVRHSAAQVAHR